jgi:hypothetical protein
MSSKSNSDKIVDEREDELNNYHRKFTKYRATFVENTSSLEVQLEWIISSYFSKSFDDYLLLNHLIFSDTHLRFSDKIIMFSKLGIFLPEFKEGLSDVVSQLNQIRRLRDDFTHASRGIYEKDISRIDKEILFLVVEKGVNKQKNFTFDYIDSVLENCKKLNTRFADVISNVKRKNNINQNETGWIVPSDVEII